MPIVPIVFHRAQPVGPFQAHADPKTNRLLATAVQAAIGDTARRAGHDGHDGHDEELGKIFLPKFIVPIVPIVTRPSAVRARYRANTLPN